jgi:hypothetical protein
MKNLKGPKIGQFNRRKLPSQRKRLVRQPRSVPVSRLWETITHFYVEAGLPNPHVPPSYKHRPKEWWKLKCQELKDAIKLIEDLEEALTKFEDQFPELAASLPWAEERKKYRALEVKPEIDVFKLASVIWHKEEFFKIAFYKSEFYRACNGQGSRNFHSPEKKERAANKKAALKAARMLNDEK